MRPLASSTDSKRQQERGLDDYSDIPDYQDAEYEVPRAGLAFPSFPDVSPAAANNFGSFFNNNAISASNFLGFNPVPLPFFFNPFDPFFTTLFPQPFTDLTMSDQRASPSQASGLPLVDSSNGQDNATDKTIVAMNTQAELNKKAAELKRRLLEKRTQAAKDASTATQHGRIEKSHSGSVREFIPHVAPRSIQEVRQPSVTANDSDIAALIADISSAAAAEEAAQANMKAESTTDYPKKSDDQNTTAPSSDRDNSANGPPKDTKQSNDAYERSRTLNEDRRRQNPIASSAWYTSTKHNSRASAAAEAKPSSDPLTVRTLRHPPAREDGELSSSTISPTENQRLSNSIRGPTKQRFHHEGPSESSRPTNNHQVGKGGSGSSGPAPIKGINPNDPDLKDWLVFTNWHDLDYRAAFLSRRRRLAMIDAERAELLEEENAMNPLKLQLSTPTQAPAPVRPSPVATSAKDADVTMSNTTDATTRAQDTPSSANKRGHDASMGENTNTGSKRSRLHDSNQYESSEEHWRYESYKPGNDDHSYGRRPSTSRKWSPNRGTHHNPYSRNDDHPYWRHDRDYDRRTRDYDDYQRRGRSDRSRSPARRGAYGAERGSSRHRGSNYRKRFNRPLDLGRKGGK